jgi:glycosyl transferase family 22 (putative mannosyltransferase)
MNYIKRQWNDNPLMFVMVVAIILRLLAAFFAKGFGMHDDHYGPLQQPFEIMLDYSVWEGRGNPHGHSIAFPTLHYYFFHVLEFFGITDGQSKALGVRLILGMYSLITVFFGYKIAEEISTKSNARLVGLVLAAFWVLPFMSVRSLIEMAAIPPMMAAFYYIVRREHKDFDYWLVGILFGISFIFRYHTSFMLFALLWVWLFRKEYSYLIKSLFGFIISITVIQGTIDWLAWGYPFAAPIEYFYFSMNDGAAITGPWYQYILLMIGLLIPPASFAFIYGFGRVFKKYYMIAIPVLFFFIIHSITPHKQERFLLPIIPLFIILAIIGWQEFVVKSGFWSKHAKLAKSVWVWFWVFNSALLIIFTFTYSKKTRCETMTYLSTKSDVNGIFLEPGRLGNMKLPTFYLNRLVPIFQLKADVTIEDVQDSLTRANVGFPEYAIFYGVEEIEARKKFVEDYFDVKYKDEAVINPSLIDDILYKLNPEGNKNQTAFIFKLDED